MKHASGDSARFGEGPYCDHRHACERDEVCSPPQEALLVNDSHV
jgi:hypothetical protein